MKYDWVMFLWGMLSMLGVWLSSELDKTYGGSIIAGVVVIITLLSWLMIISLLLFDIIILLK